MLKSVIIIFLLFSLLPKWNRMRVRMVMKTKQTETGSWRNLFSPFAPVQENLSMKQPQTDFKEFPSFVSTLFTQFIAWAILQAIQFTATKASVTVYTLLLRDGHACLEISQEKTKLHALPNTFQTSFSKSWLRFFFSFFNVHFTQRIAGGQANWTPEV